MQKITPFIWCNQNAEEMMDFYLSVFKQAKTVSVSRNTDEGSGPEGSVLVGVLELEGLQVMLLNGGPEFPPTEAFSLFISCDTQEEIDYYWERLTSDGGTPGACGWLKDKFGVSWQVAPSNTGEVLSNSTTAQKKAWMKAMMTMHKMDLKVLEAAVANA